ncbi:VOC family protein [Falsarthrobacter nasiphocae]|uniref:Enzyme related to lactoylglutathione lyase n=1 Tax=Falsarthrobacter nasiphocae TaxID=189863 RepID=A0AAE4C4N5_9MICC|nr:VOC family protein [Falsarthrobacter nasiphocae]MDR6891531.1 putative enzyme related to lactoylglutathione lyase [Falsarthrobacter nasiphocae]
MSAHLNLSHLTIALDAPDAPALATFYATILGWETSRIESQTVWVNVYPAEGTAPFSLGIQQVENYRAPEWPNGDIPQQAHLDFDVASLAESEPLVLAAGATKHPVQPSKNGNFIVYLDPAGHPFCLCQA